MGTLRWSYVMVIAEVGKGGQGNSGADGISGRGVDGVAPQSDVKRFNLRGCPPFERREGWGSPLVNPSYTTTLYSHFGMITSARQYAPAVCRESAYRKWTWQ